MLNINWAQATSLCNWAVTELAKADVIRQPDKKKLPKADLPYLYPEARKLFPGLASQTVVALLNTVEKKYRKARYERIWLGAASLQTYKYPEPIPVPAASFNCEMMKRGKDSIPVVRLRIGDQRFDLQLRGGVEWARQLYDFKMLVRQEAQQRQLDIYRKWVTVSDTWNGVEDRKAGGGNRQFYRIMVKIGAWLPRKPISGRKGKHPSVQLALSTGKDFFWKMQLDGGEPWILNADHVRRWVLAYSQRLNRLSQDRKFGPRRSERDRRPLKEHGAIEAHKQNARLDTWCHTAAKLITDWCVRKQVTRVQYDDAEKTYKDFPWHRLKTLLKEKLNVAGIDFAEIAVASAAVPEEPSTSARADAKS